MNQEKLARVLPLEIGDQKMHHIHWSILQLFSPQTTDIDKNSAWICTQFVDTHPNSSLSHDSSTAQKWAPMSILAGSLVIMGVLGINFWAMPNYPYC